MIYLTHWVRTMWACQFGATKDNLSFSQGKAETITLVQFLYVSIVLPPFHNVVVNLISSQICLILSQLLKIWYILMPPV